MSAQENWWRLTSSWARTLLCDRARRLCGLAGGGSNLPAGRLVPLFVSPLTYSSRRGGERERLRGVHLAKELLEVSPGKLPFEGRCNLFVVALEGEQALLEFVK